MAGSALVLIARAIFGPFRLLVSVASPINAESFLALAALLLLVTRAQRNGESAERVNDLNDRTAVVVLVAAWLAAWTWICWFPFVADDYSHIANGLLATPSYLLSVLHVPPADRFFRPFGLTAYAAQAQLWGKNRIAWHAASLLLHLLNSVLVYVLAKERGSRRWPALAAGLFFMLCGARPEAVAWIGAQFDLWATLFFLLALLALGRFLKTGDRRWEATELGALLLALLSKESAYVFPLVVGLMLWIDGVRGRKFLRALWPSVAITTVVFAYRWMVLQGIGGYRMVGTGKPFFYSVSPFRTGKALLLRLPAILVFPINWTRQPEWWLTIALIAGIVALALVAGAKLGRKELWFALGFMLAAAVPVHQFLLIGPDLEKSRVLYLPSVGFALLLAAGFATMRASVAAVAACSILAFQTAALEHNLAIWRNVAMLVERTCAGVARAAASDPRPLATSDVPNDIDGVYFLHTGFRPCVEWAAGKPLPGLSPQMEFEGGPVSKGPKLLWSNAQRAFITDSGERLGEK
jgi:hypothetical protein